MNKENTVVVFNPLQCKKYILWGLKPIDIIVSKKDGRLGYIFDREKSNPLYTKWLNREN